MLGENIAKVSKPKEREQVAPAQLEQVRKGVLFSGEWEGVRRDGEPVWLMLTTKLLKNSQGETVGMIGVGKDITERKKAEEALRGSEEKWRSLAENAPNIIVIVDRVGTIEFINRTVVNARPEEIVGKSIYDFIDAEHHNMVKKTIEQVFQTGEGGRYEISGVGPKGSVAWYATHVGPIKHDGQVAYVTLITTDFTERKKGEHALLESQQKFERLFKGIPEATAVVDVNDCVLDLNPRFRQLFGYSVDEARGKPLDDLIVPNDKKREAKMLTENSKEGYVLFETVRKAKDGSLVPVSISAAPISVEGQHVGDIVLYYNITGRKQTEETLRKSEKKYRSLFEDSSDGLVLVDRDDGSILDCNPEFMCQTGRNKEQLLKMKIWDIRPSHLREAAKKEFFEVKQKGFGGSMELAFQKPSGETVLVDFLSKTAKVGDREVLQSRCRDITERRKAEQALKESEEKYRRLVELAPDGMVAVNAEGIVTSANRSFLKLVGYDSEEGIVGKPFTELVTIQGEDIPRFQEMFSSLMNGEPLSPVEFLYVRKDGTSRWAEVHPGLLIKDGKPAGAQVIMRDVSERKNAEKLIQENQQKFEQLFMSNPEAAVYVDPNERVLNVSPRFTELFGYSFDEVKGKFLDDFVVPDDRKKEALMLTQKGKEGYVYYETVRKNKKGSLIPVTLSTAPIMLQGQHIGGIVLYKDTTERRNMTESLENSEKRLRILFESAPDGYYLSDLSGTLVDGNKAAEKITGYAKTELIGKSFSKLLPRSQILKAAKLLGLNAAGKSTGPDEFVLNRKDGTQVTVEIRTHPVRIEDQRLVLGIARDITERKRGERLILENQQKFEHLFRGNPEATVFLDSSFHVLDIGPRFTSLFGYTLDEIRGKHINDVVATKNMMEEARMLDEKAAKGYVYHDAVRMRKDGSLIPVSISAAPILIQGQLAGYIGVYKDVSQLKKAEGELRRAMEGLQVMNEKLRVVGGLTRHDVNNKLTAVAGYTYLARNKLPGNSEVLDYLKQIEASIEQTVKIFGFAKTYEMLGVEELAYVDVEKTVDEAVSLFPSLKDIKVVNDCHGLTVLADSLLRQLFYNLVDNSLKYGEKLSRIRVSYEDKTDHLNVIYEDDGVGIPHAAKPKLFDEGYTTGKGSGYGLFLVKRMMEVYGWTIQETGIQGKGARFILTVLEKSQQGKPLYKLP
jgi:PAS domain S-box-containing protein